MPKKQLPYPEAQLQKDVGELLTLYGWLWTHYRPARTKTGWVTAIQGSPGFPDIVAVRGDRLLFIELKGRDSLGQGGKVRKEQWDWIKALVDIDRLNEGVSCHLWEPADWEDGFIQKVLKAEGVKDGRACPGQPRRSKAATGL